MVAKKHIFRETDQEAHKELEKACMARIPANDAVLRGDGFRPTDNGLTIRDFTLDDPYDLAPAERILATAIEEDLAQCEDGQPLVILMGENHYIPSHKMAQISALSHLTARRDAAPEDPARNFLFADEISYNKLADVARKAYHLPVSSALRHYLHKSDPQNDIFIQSNATHSLFALAPQAKNRVLQTARQRRIPVVFNDTARNLKIIDPVDPAVPSAAEHLRVASDLTVNLSRSVSAIDPVGIALRNRVMVDRALDAAAEAGSRIIVQSCGLNHVLGNKNDRREYRHSLAAQFAVAGVRVLPVFITFANHTPERALEDKALKNHPNSIVLRGLSDGQHSYKNPAAERAHLDRLVSAYSGAACPFAGDDLPLPLAKEEARAVLEDVIRRAEERLMAETASRSRPAANRNGSGPV